jgi:3-hydroxyisobutyrate dehydrogenase/glyoxylate/succinic semialdehyde reductase
MATIGFIGTGLMGGRIARRLLDAGHRMVVYNRTAEKAQELLDAGATWGASPRGVAKEADVVWTMLSTPPVVEAIATEKDGFLDSMRAGAMWIDSSTVGPACSRRMAKSAKARGVRFLDAPVSGSTGAAETGQLLFLVGGDPEDVEAARPLLLAAGRKIIHAGEEGKGSALKLVFNQLLGTALLGAAEAVLLGAAMELDRDELFRALEDCGALPTPLRDRIRSSVAEGAHDPGFPLEWIEKDLRLAEESADAAGVVLPMTNAAATTYGLARIHGWDRHSITAVYEFLSGAPVPARRGGDS